MGFNSEDSNNLNRAAMFGCTNVDTGHKNEMLTVFTVAKDDYGDDAATVLSQAMMSAARFDQDVTVWIDVQLPYIPTFVSDAINMCLAFGMRLVLTNGAACSHAPGEPLSEGLLNAIEKASVSRKVWHPIEKKLVPGIKESRLG